MHAYQAETKEFMTMTMFEYPILIVIDFLRFYFLLFSLVLVSTENLIKHSRQCFTELQTPESTSKILRNASLSVWSNTAFR